MGAAAAVVEGSWAAEAEVSTPSEGGGREDGLRVWVQQLRKNGHSCGERDQLALTRYWPNIFIDAIKGVVGKIYCAIL